jgi:hypothetical protein
MLTRSYCKLFCTLKRHNIHQSQRSAIHDRGGEHLFKLYRLYLIKDEFSLLGTGFTFIDTYA